LLNAGVSQSIAASQVNISDAVAGFDQLYNGGICDTGTVTKMNIVDILPQLANGKHCTICDEFAFRKNKISESRSRVDNSLYSFIFNVLTSCQIQDSEAVKH
jgi:hypothetical protein